MTKGHKKWIIGIDEVGRGPLAGPVTVCAVAMSFAKYKKALWSGLTDSKLMTRNARERWVIKAREFASAGNIRYTLASRSAAMIDKKGIAVCIRECVASTLAALDIDPA